MLRLAVVATGLLPLALLVHTGDGATGGAPTTRVTAPVATTPPAAPLASTSGPTTLRPATATCADVVARMSVSEQVGQLVMVAQSSTSPSRSGQRAVRRLHLGSVVLLGGSTRARRPAAEPPL